MRSIAALAVLTAAVTPSVAAAQTPPAPVPPPSSGQLKAPKPAAGGTSIRLVGSGATPGQTVAFEIRTRGRWRLVARRTTTAAGGFRLRMRAPLKPGRYRLRATVTGAAPTRPVRVRVRDVTLDAVGDINLGNGVADVMAVRGPRYPWSGVARELRSADIAFGNLECAVSTRGSAIPGKQYTFRGKPSYLRAASRYAGMDVLNLANNHSKDFGTTALLDTFRWLKRFGITRVGAGWNSAEARRPRIVRRLGLKVAFVGFSDVNPAGFGAGESSPGTVLADPSVIQADVRRAKRLADVVIATFHWGVERSTQPNGEQVFLAQTALGAGASAVIGAHPHVLQPVVRRGRRVVAYSLGNFVWSAGSDFTASTGILKLRLSARGVTRSRFLPARISGTRPVLLGR